jgi:hypothetical protein
MTVMEQEPVEHANLAYIFAKMRTYVTEPNTALLKIKNCYCRYKSTARSQNTSVVRVGRPGFDSREGQEILLGFFNVYRWHRSFSETTLMFLPIFFE